MKVGEDVLNECSKCGDVKHVVVALVGANVAQVECKECGSRHRYRARASDAAAKPKKKAKPRAKAAAKPTGPSVEPDMTRPVRAYAVTETYLVGDRIAHDSFGNGVIEKVMPKKVQAFFADGPKTLLHSRAS